MESRRVVEFLDGLHGSRVLHDFLLFAADGIQTGVVLLLNKLLGGGIFRHLCCCPGIDDDTPGSMGIREQDGCEHND